MDTTTPAFDSTDAEKTAALKEPSSPVPVQSPQPQSAKVRMLSDRVLCETPSSAETRTHTGILIPATAESMTKHGIWCVVKQVGSLVRTINEGEKVLFLADNAIQVDIGGRAHLVVRERDIHAAASPVDNDYDDDQGLYL